MSGNETSSHNSLIPSTVLTEGLGTRLAHAIAVCIKCQERSTTYVCRDFNRISGQCLACAPNDISSSRGGNSLVPRPKEEEEKGPGFSRSCMR